MRIAALAVWLAPTLALADVPLRYAMDVRLDPEGRTIEGREIVRLHNFTDQTLDSVPLHLYLNGFSSDRTSWMADGMDAGELDELLRIHPDPWGGIEVTSIRQEVDGASLAVALEPVQPDDDNPFDRSLELARLGRPVAPGEDLTLSIAFISHLPFPIARTGAVHGFVLAAQFFPKPGVLEPAGLHGRERAGFAAAQFHGPTEFYADFADWDVTVDLPLGWVTGGTGKADPPVLAAGRQRRTFHARAVHDFAFVAGSDLDERILMVTPRGGTPVEIHLLAPRGRDAALSRARAALLPALDELCSVVGPYPYDTFTVVLPPYAAAETMGMEYPNFIVGSVADPLFEAFPQVRFDEQTLVHELAHQWFYGMLASDEVSAAYLDEGLTAYWDGRLGEAAAPGASLGSLLGRAGGAFDRRRLRLGESSLHEPIARSPSWLYAPDTAWAQIYDRTALTLRTAEGLFGTDAVNRLFRGYVRAQSFHHPDLDDFLRPASLLAGVPAMLPFLDEAFHRSDVPDFRVEQADTWPWPAARGTAPEAAVVSASEAWVGGPGSVDPGRIERVTLPAGKAGGDPDLLTERGPFESKVLVRGPDWRQLPADVVLRFADGTVLTDRWDGRGDYRSYHLVTPSALVEAKVDPEARVALDPLPQNDGLSSMPSGRFLNDWSSWAAAVSAWLSAAVTGWI